MVKILPANAGDEGLIPGLGRSPEKEMATPPVFLPGEFHGQEDPGRLQSIGWQRVGQD